MISELVIDTLERESKRSSRGLYPSAGDALKCTVGVQAIQKSKQSGRLSNDYDCRVVRYVARDGLFIP